MSSAIGGGAAARATTSPQEQLDLGKALLQQKKYSESSEALSTALEMFVQTFGEVGSECAEVYVCGPPLPFDVCT
jgi:hypothetical protein